MFIGIGLMFIECGAGSPHIIYLECILLSSLDICILNIFILFLVYILFSI